MTDKKKDRPFVFVRCLTNNREIYRGCHQWFRYGLFNMSKCLMPR